MICEVCCVVTLSRQVSSTLEGGGSVFLQNVATLRPCGTPDDPSRLQRYRVPFLSYLAPTSTASDQIIFCSADILHWSWRPWIGTTCWLVLQFALRVRLDGSTSGSYYCQCKCVCLTVSWFYSRFLKQFVWNILHYFLMLGLGFWRIRKIAIKTTICFVMAVRLSVLLSTCLSVCLPLSTCPQRANRLSKDGCSWNFIFEDFS